MRKSVVVLLAAGFLIAASGLSGKELTKENETAKGGTAERPDSSIDDFSWMVGRWVGKGLGGECEEVWLPASGGSMIGTFRLTVNGKAQFYELMTITIESGRPELRVKHFNADFTGWEEKDKFITFEFDSISESGVVFNGLSYEMLPDDGLRITVRVGNGAGKSSEEVIECRRAGLSDI